MFNAEEYTRDKIPVVLDTGLSVSKNTRDVITPYIQWIYAKV